MTISDWHMFSLKGWQPFAERSAAKGWFASGSAIPFGCAEKAATRRSEVILFDFPIKCSLADLENLGCFRTVVARQFQRSPDVLPLHIIQ